MNNLSFPIGEFTAPSVIDQSQIDQWIKEIAELPELMESAVRDLTEGQLDTPYRPDGWTVRQVVHHVPDSHIGSYCRFHWALTEDNPIIKAYDEKAFANLPYHNELPIEISLSLLKALHARWVVLLRNMTKEDLEKTFLHPETKAVNVLKEVIGMYAWHGKHHLEHILALKRRMNW
ncbi:YfiT family bacillithiol transferase [Roseivirga sp. E12]|uniref:YfiT family bacillithiol transferase n=1 Tax=Roseivirga sp. E12 TaxID=2819237 RepID=UPI001ABC3783|nr:putative metal-dependent hydrolase [Roseivirga sp. E12]MBO3698215.1 putative metal-dependent hydrolase [Roseivirga sp. E12]